MPRPTLYRRAAFRTGAAVAVLFLSGCDLLTVSQSSRNIREGNSALQRNEVERAVQHYETALDGTMLSAEAHYRLGLLYEDRLKNEIGALHHFERYLELAPQGQFADDVKGYVDRLRLVIVSRLSDGSMMPAREATRLRNENLELQKQVADLRRGQPPTPKAVAAATPSPSPTPSPVVAPVPPGGLTPPPALVVAATPKPASSNPAAASGEPEVRRALPVGAQVPVAASAEGAPRAEAVAPGEAPAGGKPVRTYQVQSGDTLAGIARKFLGNTAAWPKIAQANKGTLDDPTKLKPGMILVIPE